MKYILSFFLTLSVLCMSLSAVEYGVLNTNGGAISITLAKGDLLEVINFPGKYNNSQNDPVPLFKFTHPDGSDETYMVSRSSDSSNPVIVGPTTISLIIPADGDSHIYAPCGWGMYKLTRASEVEYKNVNIISLPTSAVGAGTHEIVVEASDDLQTWTPVHSSSIGGNKAFFRTRVSLALGAEPAD